MDFAMSNGEEGSFLDCILPRISRLHGIICVELLLFFCYAFSLPYVTFTYWHSAERYYTTRSWEFLILILILIFSKNYRNVLFISSFIFLNIFPTFGVMLGLFMINGFINGVYRSYRYCIILGL